MFIFSTLFIRINCCMFILASKVSVFSHVYYPFVTQYFILCFNNCRYLIWTGRTDKMMTSGEIQSEGGRKPRGDTEHLLHRVRSSSEIVEERNDGDVEARNAVFCRICLECDGEGGQI